MSSPARHGYIDALRGYAIVGVIALHVSKYCAGLPLVARIWTEEGARGVQLFFVVSALTLTAAWYGRGDGPGRFYLRRLFRIVPMYWLAIIVFTALRIWPQGGMPLTDVAWADIALHAPLLHWLTPWTVNSVVPGGWTIAAEAMFYLVLPLLLGWIVSLRRALIALSISVAVSLVIQLAANRLFMLLTPDAPQSLIGSYIFYLPTTQLPVFIIGIATFFALRDHRSTLPRQRLEIVLVVLLVALALSPLLTLDFSIRHVWFALLLGGIAYVMGSGGGTWLVNRFIAAIGTISYSAYFVHFLVLDAANAFIVPRLGIPPEAQGGLYFAAAFVVICTATFAVSAVTYRFIEQPMIRLGGRVARRGGAVVGAGTMPGA